VLNVLAQADISNKALTSAIGNLPGTEFVSQLLSALIALGLIVGGIIFVFMLIVGSIGWITSGGDKGKNELARARISSALIGIVILFALYAIVNLVACFFETNFLRFTIGELSVTGSGSPFCP
jgi:phosphate starvation-inducible membrane PsiE